MSQGLSLEFTGCPPPGPHYRETPVPQDMNLRRILEKELDDLLEKQAVIRCSPRFIPRFSSIFFMAPKKGNKWRPILNLRPLNKFIIPKKFRMETLSGILRLLYAGLWVTSLDLKDAYLHIPVRRSDQEFLCFSCKGHLYRFVAMPFGLSTAPRIFTRVSKALAAFLRRRGIRVFMYLDDWLITAESRERCLLDTVSVIQETQSLGWVINQQKSNLVPTQQPIFLGALLDLQAGVAYPTEERRNAIIGGVLLMLGTQAAPARAWLVLLGYMASMVDLVPFCRLRMRPLHWHLLAFFKPASRQYDTLVPVTATIIPHLQWWSQWQNLSLGVRFPPPQPEVTLTTDASLLGWGAYIGEASASGQWLPPWDTFHINRLEFEAVTRALFQFLHLVRGRKVLVRSDSTTVVAYINRQGGTHSFNLWRQSWDLFLWMSQYAITLEAIHLPGIHNTRADALSCQWQQSFEWMLNPAIFSLLLDRCQIFPEVDLFASPVNNQTPLFCSQYPHQRVWHVNALSFPWKQGHVILRPSTSDNAGHICMVAGDIKNDLLLLKKSSSPRFTQPIGKISSQ